MLHGLDARNSTTDARDPTATAATPGGVLDPDAVPSLEVGGLIVQPLVTGPDAPNVLRGILPPRGVIALHGHAEPETLVLLSGELEAFVAGAGGSPWRSLSAGEIVHVPSGAGHAWRNLAVAGPAVVLVITTATHGGGGLAAVGRPVAGSSSVRRPPSSAAIERIGAMAAEPGDWLGSPAANAELGIDVG